MNTCGKVSVIQGEDRNFFLRITDVCTGNNFDLTGLSAAKAIFKPAVGSTNIEFTLAASEIVVEGSPTNGYIQIIMSAAKTAQLLSGNAQSFELELTISGEKRIIHVEKLFSVEERL